MRRLLDARTGGLLVLALLIAALPLILPNKFYYDVAIKTLLNALVCVGLNLLIGYAGQISLGHAGFFALGGYASAILTARYQWNGLAALTVGMVGVGLLAFVIVRFSISYLDGDPGRRGALDRLVVRPVPGGPRQLDVAETRVGVEAVPKEAHPAVTPTSPRPGMSGTSSRFRLGASGQVTGRKGSQIGRAHV